VPEIQAYGKFGSFKGKTFNIHALTMQEEEKRQQAGNSPSMMIDVLIRYSRHDSPAYLWDRVHECLRLAGIHQARPGLPMDIATFQLEQQLELPILLLCSCSVAPGTLVQARLIGALSPASLTSALSREHPYPTDRRVFVAVAEVDASLAAYRSLEMLSPDALETLKLYVQAHIQENQEQIIDGIQLFDAANAMRIIRETRVLLKRERREKAKGKNWLRHEVEERAVTWRTVESFAEFRARLLLDNALRADPDAPYTKAEQLIRFVPQRFQKALGNLLLVDEQVLAFAERPPLRHRAGLLGLQAWHSNEGLFLITDRHVIWLRDFFTPSGNFMPGGYIAHMAPLERLQNITILASGNTPAALADRLETRDSPYLRLVLEIASRSGSEFFVVEFPQSVEAEKALAHIHTTLSAFLPLAAGSEDRRVRRLPVVEAWLPRGLEAERIAGLGGIMPQHLIHRLERQLSLLLDEFGEELLVSACVPALEDFKSPARLIALTRNVLIVLEDHHEKSKRSPVEKVRRFDLTTITSAQLRYSLAGSSLSLFVPDAERGKQYVFPFHSPAIAWFLPLFTRLRTLLGGPTSISSAIATLKEDDHG
jgi:hypothetical protein